MCWISEDGVLLHVSDGAPTLVTGPSLQASRTWIRVESVSHHRSQLYQPEGPCVGASQTVTDGLEEDCCARSQNSP